MKCEIRIDPQCDEKVIIYAREDAPFLHSIRQFVEESTPGFLGFRDTETVMLNPYDICCITVIDRKVYAICDKENLQLRERLYTLEAKLPPVFVKVNQSCLANITKIQRFDTSISGTLKLHFKNGYTDYVSRRQLKAVKERIGI